VGVIYTRVGGADDEEYAAGGEEADDARHDPQANAFAAIRVGDAEGEAGTVPTCMRMTEATQRWTRLDLHAGAWAHRSFPA
jgi:hypothetical protein